MKTHNVLVRQPRFNPHPIKLDDPTFADYCVLVSTLTQFMLDEVNNEKFEQRKNDRFNPHPDELDVYYRTNNIVI